MGLAAAFAPGLIGGSVGADDRRSPDPVPAFAAAPTPHGSPATGPTLRPDVACNLGVCALRLKAFRDGTTWLTDPLIEFLLFAGEDYAPTPLAAAALRVDGLAYGWTLGSEERAVEMTVQPVGGTRAGTNLFIVELRGGREELRQTHRVIEIHADAGPIEHLRVKDGEGPFSAQLLWDSDGFTHVVTPYLKGLESRSTRYVWRVQSGERRLMRDE